MAVLVLLSLSLLMAAGAIAAFLNWNQWATDEPAFLRWFFLLLAVGS